MATASTAPSPIATPAASPVATPAASPVATPAASASSPASLIAAPTVTTPTQDTTTTQTFWDKYGKIITGIGYGLVVILLFVVIYLATRSCSNKASPKIADSYSHGSTMEGGRKGRRGLAKQLKKGLKKLKGGCGCTGISGAMP